MEVARGADSVDAPNNYADQSMPAPLPTQPPRNIIPAAAAAVSESLPQRDDVALLHNEEVQVHQPPPEAATAAAATADAAPEAPMQKTKTGLSQSDLSLTSSCDSNTGYTYGTQAAYTVDAAGYQTPVCQPQVVPPLVAVVPGEPASKTPATVAIVADPVVASAPVIRAAIFKQENGQPPIHDATETPTMDDEQPSSSSSPASQTIAAPLQQPIKMSNGCANGAILCGGSVPPSPLTNGNGCAGGGAGGFDSLLNLPEPPSMDEIQMLNEFGMSGDNNMDSLPPPPLEMMDATSGGIAVAGVN